MMVSRQDFPATARHVGAGGLILLSAIGIFFMGRASNSPRDPIAISEHSIPPAVDEDHPAIKAMRPWFVEHYFEPFTIEGGPGKSRILNETFDPAIILFTSEATSSPGICWLYGLKDAEDYGVLVGSGITGEISLDTINVYGFGDFHSYRIDCPASWTLDVIPFAEAPEFTVPGTRQGQGDMIFRLRGMLARTIDVITNPGPHPDLYTFSLQAFTPDGPTTLVSNAKAGYEDKLICPYETFLIVIKSDVNWKITVNEH